MTKLLTPASRAFVYHDRANSIVLANEQGAVSHVKHVFAYYSDSNGEFVIGATDNNGRIYMRVHGGQLVDTGVDAIGRPNAGWDVLYYVNKSDGKLHSAEIDVSALENGTNPLNYDTEEGTEIYEYGAICSSEGDILYYDNGGLRVRTDTVVSNVRLYPQKAKYRLDDFNAAIVRGANDVYALCQIGNSIVLYRISDDIEHKQRIVLTEDSLNFTMLGGLTINDNTYIYGIYNDSAVLFRLYNDAIALSPLGRFIEISAPFAIAFGDGAVLLTTFNETGIIQAPDHIIRTEYTFALDENDIRTFKINDGAGSITLTRNADIRFGDAIELHVTRDNWQTENVLQLIASGSPVIEHRGADISYTVPVMVRDLWKLNYTRVPNYLQIQTGSMLSDMRPGMLQALYKAPHSYVRASLEAYAIDTWKGWKPFTDAQSVGCQNTIGITDSDERVGGKYRDLSLKGYGDADKCFGVEWELPDTIVSRGNIAVDVTGWARTVSSTGQNPQISIGLRVATNGEERVILAGPLGRFKRTYPSETTDPEVITLYGGSIDYMTIKGVILVFHTTDDGEITIADVRIRPTTGELYYIGNSVEFTHDDAITLSQPGALAVFLSTQITKQPYFVAKAKFLSQDNAIYGIALFARDASSGLAVLCIDGEAKLVRLVENGYTELHTFGQCNTQTMRVTYHGGTISVAGIGDYELSVRDGFLMPSDDNIFAGVVLAISGQAVQALAHRYDGAILIEGAPSIESDGKLVFDGVSDIEYDEINYDGFADGPWQLRNVQSWRQSEMQGALVSSRMAVEIKKLYWKEHPAGIVGKELTTSTGYKWVADEVDGMPFIHTNGQVEYLPDRMRIYSESITGTELVGTDTKVWIGGTTLHTKEHVDTYVSPYSVGIVSSHSSVSLLSFSLFENNITTLREFIRQLAHVAEVDL